jgi:hypothetical protein
VNWYRLSSIFEQLQSRGYRVDVSNPGFAMFVGQRKFGLLTPIIQIPTGWGECLPETLLREAFREANFDVAEFLSTLEPCE